MPKEKKGQILVDATEKIINDKMSIVETKLREADKMPYEELLNLVLEANNLILFICGDDFETYETWKYRLFVNSEGGVYLTQGVEVDTDYFPSDYKPLDEE